MIPEITSLAQAMELAAPEFAKIRARVPGSYMAGGYLRDADNGVQPKDRDYFLWAPNQEEIDQCIAQIADDTGHTFKLLGTTVGETRYPEGLVVYESEEKPEGDFPLNLIFAVGVEHTQFDLGLCEIYWWQPDSHPYKTGNYIRDQEARTLTLVNWTPAKTREEPLTQELYEADFAHTLNHIRRIKEKYPDFQVLIHHNALPTTHRWGPDAAVDLRILGYDILIKENFIGNPGEILPPEGQEPDGNDLGQQDGTEDLVEVEAALANRRDVARERIDAAIEALARRVRDTPQVQPGLNDLDWVQQPRPNPFFVFDEAVDPAAPAN